MIAVEMKLRSKIKQIMFGGAIFIIVEFLHIMTVNYENHSEHVRQVSETETSDSKEDFQRVTDDNSLLVYSAYMEEKTGKLRVIGITSMKNNSQIYCILRYNSPKHSRVVEAALQHIPESHGRRYAPAFILCYLTDATVPDEVSISISSSTKHVHNVLRVKRIVQQRSKHVFSACVSPLHSTFNDTTQLIEWIELNKQLGVEKFIFYINSVSKHMLRLLEFYESKGVVTLLPWTLPRTIGKESNKLLHYYGQLAALNDCLYRSKGKSQYISTTDLDEFIIPQKPDEITWSDMLSKLPSYSVYLIRCSFFSQKISCSRKEKCRERLTIESYKLRDDFILPSHKRSKYIAKTDEVETMGIHFIWHLLTGSEYTVNPEVALLHHYRRESKTYTKTAFTKITHRAATKYSSSLLKNVDLIKKMFLFSPNKTVI